MTTCYRCTKPAVFMCMGCKSRFYCGAECQQSDWIAGHHQTECGTSVGAHVHRSKARSAKKISKKNLDLIKSHMDSKTASETIDKFEIKIIDSLGKGHPRSIGYDSDTIYVLKWKDTKELKRIARSLNRMLRHGRNHMQKLMKKYAARHRKKKGGGVVISAAAAAAPLPQMSEEARRALMFEQEEEEERLEQKIREEKARKASETKKAHDKIKFAALVEKSPTHWIPITPFEANDFLKHGEESKVGNKSFKNMHEMPIQLPKNLVDSIDALLTPADRRNRKWRSAHTETSHILIIHIKYKDRVFYLEHTDKDYVGDNTGAKESLIAISYAGSDIAIIRPSTGMFYKRSANQDVMNYIAALFESANKSENPAEQLIMLAGGDVICSICGRELTAATSIENKMGPVCYGKMKDVTKHAKNLVVATPKPYTSATSSTTSTAPTTTAPKPYTSATSSTTSTSSLRDILTPGMIARYEEMTLTEAIREENIDAATWLLTKPEIVRKIDEVDDRYIMTPLQLAIESNNLSLVKLVIDHGADIHAEPFMEGYEDVIGGYSMLDYAISISSKRSIRELLKSLGLTVNQSESEGEKSGSEGSESEGEKSGSEEEESSDN